MGRSKKRICTDCKWSTVIDGCMICSLDTSPKYGSRSEEETACYEYVAKCASDKVHDAWMVLRYELINRRIIPFLDWAEAVIKELRR